LRYFRFSVGLLILAWIASSACAGSADVPNAGRLESIRAIVEEFRARRPFPEQITIRIVKGEKKLVSVRRSPGQPTMFLLTFDEAFLATLNQDELRAVIAHELGHVWIFTHHPYLHTEALANRRAVEFVPAEALEQVYRKVLNFGGRVPDNSSPSQPAIAETPKRR